MPTVLRSPYNNRRWRTLRARFLKANPLCAYCEREGTMTPATIADHKTPHRGDPALMWDEGNLQPLCKRHHDSAKQAEEKGRTYSNPGPDGWPL